jgi:hypothetical protein
MALIIVIMVLAVAILVGITVTQGVEAALPFFTFLVILLPGEVRIDFGDLFVLTATRLAIGLLLVLYFVFGTMGPPVRRKDSLPLKYILLLYLVWSIISAFNSVVLGTSLKVVISLVLDFYVVYYIFYKAITRVETIHKILAAAVAALVVCCILGVVERFTGWKVNQLFPEVTHRFAGGVGGVSADTGRLQSTFPHAILFANALALGIPWVLYLLSRAQTRARRIYLWAAIIIMFYDIYKTMSRGPWLALVMSLLLLLFFSERSIRKYLIIIFLISVSSLIIRPGVWETLRDTYWGTLDPDSPRGASYQYRYDLFHTGRRALAGDLGRALWGFGPESFYYLGLESENPITGHTEKLESCDSAFVEVMVDTGYVGLLLIVVLLATAGLYVLHAFARVPKPQNLLCLVFLVNIVAYSFMMVSVENFGWGQQTFMLWIILALAMVYPRIVLDQSVPQPNNVPDLEQIPA